MNNEETNIIERPTCSCGAKMQIVRYVGYYDEFNYWTCPNQNCNIDADDFESESEWHGCYA